MSLVKSPKGIVDEAEVSDSQGLLVRHPSWPRREVRDFATIQNGSPFASSLFTQDGKGFPLIRIRDVGKNRISTYFDGEYSEEYVVRAGDLLIGMDGDFRSSRWQGPDALLNQRVCRLVVDAEVMNPVFVEYALQGYLDAICAATSSITVKHLSSKTIQDIPLPIPPLAEQQRIVEILEEQFSRLDAALASIRTVREKAAAFRRSLLQAAFSGELSEDGSAAWELRKFSEVAHVDSNLTDPKTCGDLPHIAPNHIEAGTGRLLEYTTVKADGVTSAKHLFHPGHILYSKIRPYLNKVALVDFGGLCSADMYPISTSQDATWLFYVMLSPEFVRLVSGTQNRTVLPKTNVRDLSAITIPVPPISIQHRIVEVLEEQFSRLDAASLVANQLEARIASERRSLLHAAFSGALTEQWRTTHNG